MTLTSLAISAFEIGRFKRKSNLGRHCYAAYALIYRSKNVGGVGGVGDENWKTWFVFKAAGGGYHTVSTFYPRMMMNPMIVLYQPGGQIQLVTLPPPRGRTEL